MARDITTINQTNLWGKQADTGLGLEPQRTDLFFVDFKNAVNGVTAAAKIRLAPILPQYVRSVTLPEIRTKADPVRRDSIPYNVPSWDDPLDAVKITFLLDTHNEDDRSDVVQFLDGWLALTRAGRGRRYGGYTQGAGWLELDANYRVDNTFDVNVYMLRGADLTVGGFVNDGTDRVQFQTFMAQANAAFRNQKKTSGLVQQGAPVPLVELDNSNETAITYAQQSDGDVVAQDMVIHTIYALHDAWLAAYKIADLSYTESNIVTVDATFYVDSIDRPQALGVEGAAFSTQ